MVIIDEGCYISFRRRLHSSTEILLAWSWHSIDSGAWNLFLISVCRFTSRIIQSLDLGTLSLNWNDVPVFLLFWSSYSWNFKCSGKQQWWRWCVGGTLVRRLCWREVTNYLEWQRGHPGSIYDDKETSQIRTMLGLLWSSYHRYICTLVPEARACLTNDFLSAIQIRWKFRLIVIPLLANRSRQIVAHATTAQLSWHAQNFVAITVYESRWEWNEISTEFELQRKKRTWWDKTTRIEMVFFLSW